MLQEAGATLLSELGGARSKSESERFFSALWLLFPSIKH
jgi:hypothetical protein